MKTADDVMAEGIYYCGLVKASHKGFCLATLKVDKIVAGRVLYFYVYWIQVKFWKVLGFITYGVWGV